MCGRLQQKNKRKQVWTENIARAGAKIEIIPATLHPSVWYQSEFKILTENSKTPLSRALALASFLGSDYPSNLGARTAPPAKDLMAFGSVLAHNQNQHNIGELLFGDGESIDFSLKKKSCNFNFRKKSFLPHPRKSNKPWKSLFVCREMLILTCTDDLSIWRFLCVVQAIC